MKKVISVIFLLLSLNANAGSQMGTVDYIIVRASDGLIYFTLTGGALENRPSCATIGYWMIKDENSNAGQQQYSMILAAHAAGKTVRVTGSNTCSRWGNGEDVDALQIRNS